jgi:dTDP-4-amino-4,6-dideoxygalactose transaminase
MADDYIVFGSPSIGAEEIAAVTRTLETGWIGTGPRVHEFQNAFEVYTGAKYAVAMASCTAALHIAMVVSGLGPGDEVITTPMTFCATANAILHTGATPVFADCERDSMNIDPAAVAAAITPRTKAILPVHFAGRPVNLTALRAIAERHGLLLIEDAAHAIESKYGGQKVGAIGDVTCFSFYVTKNITTGEGGMLTTNNAELAKKAQTYALHGLSSDAWSRFSDKGYKHYDVIFPGFKYNLTDMAASLGLVQLKKIDGWLAHREALWRYYDEALAGLPLILPAQPEADSVHARHLYTVLVKPESKLSRDELIVLMHQRGIGTGVHYRALHTHPYYRDRFGYRPEQFPNAAFIGEQTISLPLSVKLSQRDAERVVAALRELLS